MSSNINSLNIFGLPVELRWEAVSINENYNNSKLICTDTQFFLNIPDTAKYLVFPKQNVIIIEKAHPEVSFEVISTWLLGTVSAYLLQYHGYLVLHGSAIVKNNKAIIFGGNSGAGKSTLAAAMVAKGYSLLTDDVVAITRNTLGNLVMIPGPSKVKLWADALNKLQYKTNNLARVINQKNKYQLPITKYHPEPLSISSFYELNHNAETTEINCQTITGLDKLQTLIRNTYRYTMLKPLGKIGQHLQDCSILANQIKFNKITRPQNKYLLNELVKLIEHTFVEGTG